MKKQGGNTIKLFAAKGACSLAPHIVIHELGLPYELKLIQLGNPAGKEELKKYNPMGQVPTLVTDEGYPLAEGQAIMQYLISKKPNSLFPTSGKDRFKAFEWMSFIATGIHKSGFTPLFSPNKFTDDETQFDTVRRLTIENLKKTLQVAEERFSDGEYVLGENFTVVDPYLFIVLSWRKAFKIDLTPYKKLNAFMERITKRPSVIAAMKAEGYAV